MIKTLVVICTPDVHVNRLMDMNHDHFNGFEFGGNTVNPVRFRLKSGKKDFKSYLKNIDFSDDDMIYYKFLGARDVFDEDLKERGLTIEHCARVMSKFSSQVVITPDGEWHEPDIDVDFGNPFPDEILRWKNEYFSTFIANRNEDDYLYTGLLYSEDDAPF